MSINNLFNIGQSALSAQQNTIAVTGNNIANVDTPGYSRQYVVLEDNFAINTGPGAQGLGVNAVEVLRRFDQFVEVSFLDKSSEAARWQQQSTTMASVESIFNESNRTGINDALANFFKGWQDLAQEPDDPARRENLLALSENISVMMQASMDDLATMKQQMELSIETDVQRVNELIEEIADLNLQITQNTIDGRSNPNNIMDQRDQAVRELAEIVDITTEYQDGAGNYTVRLTNGLPLVQGHETFELDVMSPQVDKFLKSGSTYEGNVIFSGEDSHEYTVEMLSDYQAKLTSGTAYEVYDTNGTVVHTGDLDADGDGIVDSLTLNGQDVHFAGLTGREMADLTTAGVVAGNEFNAGTYRVSLDGGQTWLRDDSGAEKVYTITDIDANGEIDPVRVHNLDISFEMPGAGESFSTGDSFTIVPKNGLYWIEPTRGPVNITPDAGLNGMEDQDRLTGGTLTAFFSVRDQHIGAYEDELDAIADALVWEVNKLHSQGAGLGHVSYFNGTESVYDTDIPLGMPQSGLHYGENLSAGNLDFHFYDAQTGTYVSGGAVDFDSTIDGIQNFDPSVHSLEHVRDALNNTYPGQLEAEIVSGKLNITVADENLRMSTGADTTGLMAALGINTFFQGNSATTIETNLDIHQDTNRIAAAYVNGSNEVLPGDNALANDVGKLLTEPVEIDTPGRHVNDQSITQYYSTLISKVGADTRTANTNAEYNAALATDLYNQQQAVSGVNLDEEMSNLIKFQHAYTAAAKLITTADEMMQTVLGLKQ